MELEKHFTVLPSKICEKLKNKDIDCYKNIIELESKIKLQMNASHICAEIKQCPAKNESKSCEYCEHITRKVKIDVANNVTTNDTQFCDGIDTHEQTDCISLAAKIVPQIKNQIKNVRYVCHQIKYCKSHGVISKSILSVVIALISLNLYFFLN